MELDESYSYEEDISDGYVFDYHPITDPEYLEQHNNISFDESQALHDTLHPQSPSPPVQPSEDNPNIVYSESLNESRKFLSEVFHVDPSSFKRFHIPGLIILRLEDYGLLRNDSRSSRVIPHLLINADPNGLVSNPDFVTALQALGVK